jgi:acetyl esterase/lipase
MIRPLVASSDSRHLLILLLAATAQLAHPGFPATAQEVAPQVLALWPGTPPDEVGNIGPEMFWEKRPDGSPIPDVAGKPVKWLTNVTKPTLTIYRPPSDKDTGVSMLICPGGGMTYLAWDCEGEEVAAWLNSVGMTGIILKYRVPRRPDQLDPKFRAIWYVRPLQDAQRALSLLRSKSGELGLNPNRIGMVGFSAGAGLVAWAATNFEKRAYEAIDAVDQVSCRPDFGVLLYPGGGASPSRDRTHYEPDANVPISAGCPPMFFACAGDDGDKAEIITALYLALKKVRVPAELHVYAKGGHDFSLRPTDNPCTTWPARCVEWMRSVGLLKPDR